jgi:hypothetical protein
VTGGVHGKEDVGVRSRSKWAASDVGKSILVLIPVVDVTSIFSICGSLNSSGLIDREPHVRGMSVELCSMEAALHDGENQLLNSGIVFDTLLTPCRSGIAGDNISPNCSKAGLRETQGGVLVSR